MDTQLGTDLRSGLHIHHLTSAFYDRLDADFDYPGEAHTGWEFVYVEQGSIRVRANDAAYILKSGEMVCHQPMEFHHLRPYGGPASIIICCFDTNWPAMEYFKGKILPISPRQKQYLNDVITYAGHLLLPKDPLDIAKDGAMDRNPAATASQEQSVKNALELLVLSLWKVLPPSEASVWKPTPRSNTAGTSPGRSKPICRKIWKKRSPWSCLAGSFPTLPPPFAGSSRRKQAIPLWPT